MEDSNKNDNNQDQCSIYCCILSIVFIILFIYTITHYFSNFLYLPEDNFLKAINKSWKKRPIMNISLVYKKGFEKMSFMNWNLDKDICDCLNIDDYEDEYEGKCSKTLIENGCNEYNKNNNSTKLYNTIIYVKYYKEDYLSLFKRIRKDKKRGKLCKKGYRKCGYLDSLNNPFCSKEGESCPINEIKFFNNKNGKINKIETYNENKSLPVFNQLIVSGINNATILDIGEFFSLNNIDNLERIREPDEIFYSLKLVKNIQNIKSYEFFLENNLIKGKIPKNYAIKNLYLFYSIYTGNNIDNSIISKNIFYTFIINRIARSILKIIILLLIIISILVCYYYRPNNKKGLKKFIYIIIIDIFFLLINFYHYKVKKEVYNIFNDYNNKYRLDDFDKPLIYEKTFLYFELIGILIFIIKVIVYCYQNYSKFKEEHNKNNNEGNSIELQNNLLDNKIKESKNENANEKILIEHDSYINESGEKQNKEKKKQINNNENENTICISIQTSDQNRSHLYACKENDQFIIYRDKFLNEFQEYKSKNIYFFSNGEKIDENKTLKENKIKDNSIIVLNINVLGD